MAKDFYVKITFLDEKKPAELLLEQSTFTSVLVTRIKTWFEQGFIERVYDDYDYAVYYPMSVVHSVKLMRTEKLDEV